MHANYLHYLTPYPVIVLIVVDIKLFYFNQFYIIFLLFADKFYTFLISDLVNTIINGLFLNKGLSVLYNLICYSILYPHC